jgi:hypothetical protein
VAFYANGALVSVLSSPPWTTTLLVPDADSLAIRVEVTDSRGQTGQSPIGAWVVQQNSPPEVSFTFPPFGEMVISGSQITCQVQASDDVGVEGTGLMVDGVPVGFSSQTWFDYTFTATQPDSVVLIGFAVDAEGDSGFSAPRTVRILPNSPPSIAITSPTAGVERVPNEKIQIEATAQDDHGLDRVEFYAGGGLIGADAAYPFRINYIIPNGVNNVEIHAIAYDGTGLLTESPHVQIPVIPDPLTTAYGRVWDREGSPVYGVDIVITPEFSAQTDSSGIFTLSDVPTDKPYISAQIGIKDSLIGYAVPQAPVRGGVTNLGEIVLRPIDSLLASWPFSRHAFDTSGRGHHGTVQGGNFTADRFGKSDSAYQFFQFPEKGYIDAGPMNIPSTAFSYTAWIKIDSLPTDWPYISHIMGGEGGGASANLQLGYPGIESDQLFLFVNGNYVNGGQLVSNTHLQIGVWYFVCATVDENTASLYLNGNPEATQNGVPLWNESGVFRLGHSLGGDGPGWGFQGTIDDARVYNRVLTPVELLDLYHESGWAP